MRAFLVFLMLLASWPFLYAQEKELTETERETLTAEAVKQNKEGDKLYGRNRFTEAGSRYEQALAINRKLYLTTKYPAGHPDLATSLNNVGLVFLGRGFFNQALPYFEQALAMRRKLYPAAKFPDGHPDLATSIHNVGFLLRRQNALDKALPYYEQALAMDQKLHPATKYPDGDPDLAISLNNVGALLEAQGAYEKALAYHKQSLAMRRKLYPPSKYPEGHRYLAESLSNLGQVIVDQGAFDKALPYFEQALAMRRKLYPAGTYPNGHPDIARSVSKLSVVLERQGDFEKAIQYSEQALAMRRKLYSAANNPASLRDLTVSVNILGRLAQDQGDLAKALSYWEQFLALNRKLYPEAQYPHGHVDLAHSLNNLGLVLQDQSASDKALVYFKQALAMRCKLYSAAEYPDGHPELAGSLHNLGSMLRAQGSFAEALPYHEQALAMYRKLFPVEQYPNGHPELAISLNSLGSLLHAQGAFDKALVYKEQALEMRRKLYEPANYPDGHRDLAQSLEGLGFLLHAEGAFAKAQPFYEQALAMSRRLTQRVILQASEAESMTYLHAQPLTRDGYLSVAAHVPNTTPTAYRAVWDSKAAVTRFLELRQALARAAGTKAADQLSRLKQVRRRVEQILQDPRLKPEERDRELTRLYAERDQVERSLAKELPIVAQWRERDAFTPEDLGQILPVGAGFIDLLNYTRFEQDSKVKGMAGEKRLPCYVAFVLAPSQSVQRIELGAAAPINQAVKTWREAIDRGQASDAAQQLRVLVWEPLARHLPRGTTTLYLALDGDLARLPWAALPVDPDRVLLEDYAVATVPHGPFLLEQLRHAPKYHVPGSLLTLGDVTYASKTWPDLPGTRAEINALAHLAPVPSTTLTKNDATVAHVTEALPKARFAHLATHGQFRSDDLTAEKKREQEARSRWQEGMGSEIRGVAAKNPLGFVGLVLANDEVLTGLGLVDLPLENLQLVTLSACETGLGELTGGEGVQGLQRAFHLAGCPNVVASLWKVNDAATAALMAKFYHEMWTNKKPPIEALREAQLTIYRRPDLILAMAGERGALKQREVIGAKSVAIATAEGAKTKSSTKLWAAFVLSGAGR